MEIHKYIFRILFLTILFINPSHAQDYQLSFTGSGLSATVSSVRVQNLTRGTSIELDGSDVLHLVANLTSLESIPADDYNVRIVHDPFRKTVNCSFHTTKTENVSLEILNITGKTLAMQYAILDEGIHTFDVSGLKSGIYLINICTSENKYTGKFISTGENSGIPAFRYLNSQIPENRPGRKNTMNTVQMVYADGERLLFKGVSGNYARVLTLISAASQAVNFEFMACTDGDDNHYAVVTIGTQTWMAENLRTTRYIGGTAIPPVSDRIEWYQLEDNNTAKAYCLNENLSPENFGALYTWAAAMNSASGSDAIPSGVQGPCPTGWHLPGDAEWSVLHNFLGVNAGGMMKETGFTHWNSPNTGATNESGFTLLPGGRRNSENGVFQDAGNFSYLWSSTEYQSDAENAWYRQVNFAGSALARSAYPKSTGVSVRCLKD